MGVDAAALQVVVVSGAGQAVAAAGTLGPVVVRGDGWRGASGGGSGCRCVSDGGGSGDGVSGSGAVSGGAGGASRGWGCGGVGCEWVGERDAVAGERGGRDDECGGDGGDAGIYFARAAGGQ